MLIHSSIRPLSLICIATVLMLSSCEKTTRAGLKQGDMFPRSALSELITDNDSATNINARTLVVNFWASWCSPCRKEMPELQRLSDTMDKQRFRVIGVSVDEDKYLMREFLLQQKIRFDNYQDINQHLARDILNIRAFPETYIISPRGIIIRRVVGEQLWNSKEVHSLLESIDKAENLLAGDRSSG